MEFDNQEYRLLDMKKFLQNEQGLLKDLCNDINLFLQAELDATSGTIQFGDVDFDPLVLYEASQDLDKLVNCQRKLPKHQKITTFPDAYKSKLTLENEQLIKLLRSLRD